MLRFTTAALAVPSGPGSRLLAPSDAAAAATPTLTVASHHFAPLRPADYVMHDWTMYNPSVTRLDGSAWSNLLRDLGADSSTSASPGDAVAVQWVGHAPGALAADTGKPQSSQCLVPWIGVISLSTLVARVSSKEAANTPPDALWLLSPRLLHNVIGGKMTDPRLFTYKRKGDERLAMVGYVEVANASIVPNMADYYVRATLISGRSQPASSNCEGTTLADCTSSMVYAPGHAKAETCEPASRFFGCCAEELRAAVMRPPPTSATPSWASGEVFLPCETDGGEVAPWTAGGHCGSPITPFMADSAMALNGVEVPLQPPKTHVPAKK